MAAPSWAAASTVGPAATVTVQLSPSLIAADGSSTTATATVEDASGNGVSGDTLQFTSTDPGATVLGPVSDNGNGTYSVTIIGSTTPGQSTITATDASGPSGQATLTQYGPAASATVSLSPSTLVADGQSTTTATATVVDAEGDPVAGDDVTFGSTDPGQQIVLGTPSGNGTYPATIKSSTTLGQSTITATDNSAVNVSGSATLTQTVGPAASVKVALAPASIVADGKSTSTATATVEDAEGHPVSGDNVSFSSTDSGQQIVLGTPSGNGTYPATIKSSTTVGQSTITATDSSAAPNVSGTATLTQTVGPAANVTVALAPASIVADGKSTSTATATVTDAEGHLIPGENVGFSSTDGGEQIGKVTDHHDGTYTAVITSSKKPGTPTITATDQATSVAGQSQLTQTAGPAAHVNVSLATTSIPASGASQTQVTAAVTDANGNPVAGDTVALSSTDAGQHFGPVTDNGNGTYTATLTSSKKAWTSTITATDSSVSPSVSGQALLKQTVSQAAHVSVSLSPSSIVADGVSQSTATATVTDANGNPVAGDKVTFGSTDPGEQFGSVVDNGNGTYTASITSSKTVATATITASDSSVAPAVSGQGQLTQTPATSRTLLTVNPSAVVSNQTVNLVAAISAATTGTPSGTITFSNGATPIPGCTGEPITPGNPTATCATSFGSGQQQLSAVFTPDASSTVAGSTGTATLAVTQDSTSTSVSPSSPSAKIGAPETYTAVVTPQHPGSLLPSGTVAFRDGGRPISQCAAQPIVTSGGSAVATCRITYPAAGAHSISAVYGGDGNFGGSSSGAASLPVQYLGLLSSSVRWSFISTGSYTKVLELLVERAPAGSTVTVSCRGSGCPKGASIKLGHPGSSTVSLTSRFARNQLKPGATISVSIVRPGWIGKAYTFVVRTKHPPRMSSTCVTSTRAAVAC